MKKVKNLKVYAASALLVATLAILPGCAKTMDCNIKTDHAHKYQTAYGIETYRASEREKLGDLHWTENYVPISDETNIMTKHDLVRIDENISAIDSMIEQNVPYQEYEYKQSYIIMVGKVPVTQTRRRWTTDENHSRLTGNIRDVDYMYHAYQTYVDKKGKVQIGQSGNVEDIFSIASEYPYIKLGDYHDLVYSEAYTKEEVMVR